MINLNPKLAKIEEKLENAEDVSALLDELGIKNKTTGGNVYIDCPKCAKPNKIGIRVHSNEKDRLHWLCWNSTCRHPDSNKRIHAHYYDNLIGLVRMYHDCSPLEAFTMIEAAAYKLEQLTAAPFKRS